MKRTLCIIIIISMLSFCAISSEALTMKSNDVSIANNRLFDIEVMMKDSCALTASTISIYYDNSSIAYRDVKTTIDGAKVRAKDNGKTVKVIFLCPYGVKLDNSPVLFSAKFKSLKSGESKIKLKAEDCVDVDVKNIKAPKPKKITVNISESNSSNHSVRAHISRKSSEKTSDKKDKSKSKTSNSKKEDTKTSKVSVPEGKSTNPFIIAIAALSAALTAALIFIITTKPKKHKKHKMREE